MFALVVGGADSKEGMVGDNSICGFDIDFVLCLCLYRLKRRGGGRYKSLWIWYDNIDIDIDIDKIIDINFVFCLRLY